MRGSRGGASAHLIPERCGNTVVRCQSLPTSVSDGSVGWASGGCPRNTLLYEHGAANAGPQKHGVPWMSLCQCAFRGIWGRRECCVPGLPQGATASHGDSTPPPWHSIPFSRSLRERLRLREPESLGTVAEPGALGRMESGGTVRNSDLSSVALSSLLLTGNEYFFFLDASSPGHHPTPLRDYYLLIFFKYFYLFFIWIHNVS